MVRLKLHFKGRGERTWLKAWIWGLRERVRSQRGLLGFCPDNSVDRGAIATDGNTWGGGE